MSEYFRPQVTKVCYSILQCTLLNQKKQEKNNVIMQCDAM